MIQAKLSLFALTALACGSLNTIYSQANTEQKEESSSTTIYVEPQGEYASIDMKESKAAIEALMGNNQTEKKDWAEKITKDPGSYNPAVLLALGSYLLEQNNYEQAALYFQAALLRTLIDVKLSQDPTLQDTPSIIAMSINDIILQHVDTPEKEKQWIQAAKSASKKILAWDTETPRNYDERWVSLHSMRAFTGDPMTPASKENKQQIIDEIRKEFQDAIAKAASQSDTEPNDSSKSTDKANDSK